MCNKIHALCLIAILLLLPVIALAQDSGETNDDPGPGQRENQQEENNPTPGSGTVEEAAESDVKENAAPASTGPLVYLLLALILAVALYCLFLLQVKLIGRLASMERYVRGGLSDQLKIFSETLREIRDKLPGGFKKETPEPKPDLSANLDRLQTGLQELLTANSKTENCLNLMLNKQTQPAVPPVVDLSQISEQLNELKLSQREILTALAQRKSEIPSPTGFTPIQQVTPSPAPETERDRALRELDASFASWCDQHSLNSNFLAQLPLGADTLYSAAPQRNSLLAEYRLSIGNTPYGVEDCFAINMQKGQKPGIVIRIEKPAVILLKSYGQTELIRKGSLTKIS